MHKKAVACIAVLALILAPFKAASADNSTDQPLTAAQWLDVVKQQTVEAKKYEDTHPDEALLMYGATQAIPYQPKDKIARWSQKYQDGYKAYQAWWKSEGEAAFNKWRQAGFPVTQDPHFLLYHAAALGLYSVLDRNKPGNDKDILAYGDAIISRGKEVMLKGWTGPISKDEMAQLRLYAMYICHIDPGAAYPEPSYQGGMDGVGSPNPGDPAPDFTLPLMEEILARPTYSDASPYDEMHLFRPDISLRLLNIMTGYEAADAAHKKPGVRVQAKPYNGEFKNPVTLSSFQGKKPVLFCCEDAVDTWTWSGEVAPLYEPLYQAVKDKVAIFFIHTTVHDQFMPGSINDIPGVPDFRALHPTSLEQRARSAKMFYMTYPTISFPYLLDDLGEHVENFYQCGGGETATYLVDKAGIVSYSQWQSGPSNDYMWIDIGNNNSHRFPVQARNQRVMNLVECNLKALLDAGGVWNKSMKPVTPDWRLSPWMENASVTAVDPVKGQITLVDKTNPPVTINVDNQTRIIQGTDHKAPGDLKVGQTISISYQKDHVNNTGWLARYIVIGGGLDPYWIPVASWVPAVVQSVDAKSGLLKAKMTLRTEDSKGMAFWQNPSPEMTAIFGPFATSPTSFPQLFKNIVAKADQVLNIHIDRANDIFLDGMTAQLSDLRPGDRLGIELSDNFNPDNVSVHFIRAYRY